MAQAPSTAPRRELPRRSGGGAVDRKGVRATNAIIRPLDMRTCLLISLESASFWRGYLKVSSAQRYQRLCNRHFTVSPRPPEAEFDFVEQPAHTDFCRWFAALAVSPRP